MSKFLIAEVFVHTCPLVIIFEQFYCNLGLENIFSKICLQFPALLLESLKKIMGNI